MLAVSSPSQNRIPGERETHTHTERERERPNDTRQKMCYKKQSQLDRCFKMRRFIFQNGREASPLSTSMLCTWLFLPFWPGCQVGDAHESWPRTTAHDQIKKNFVSHCVNMFLSIRKVENNSCSTIFRLLQARVPYVEQIELMELVLCETKQCCFSLAEELAHYHQQFSCQNDPFRNKEEIVLVVSTPPCLRVNLCSLQMQHCCLRLFFQVNTHTHTHHYVKHCSFPNRWRNDVGAHCLWKWCFCGSFVIDNWNLQSLHIKAV